MEGLTQHEKHAQGALIRRAIEERLSGIELAVTFAFYGKGAIRARAIVDVTHAVSSLVRRTGLCRELVNRYFATQERRKSQGRIAQDFNLSQQTVSRLDITIGMCIEKLRIETEARLEAMFVANGIAEGI